MNERKMLYPSIYGTVLVMLSNSVIVQNEFIQ